jgi:hypothetical protein
MRDGDGHQEGVFRRFPLNLNPVALMKMKLFALGGLCLVGWALSACQASAFGLFPCCFHKNYSVIVCRPYNAFTPICCGNVVCDGCCPSPYCGGPTCQLPIQNCFASAYGGQSCCVPYAASQLSSQPSAIPTQNAPTFTPPPPLPNTVYNQTSMRYPAQGMYPVQPAAYYPPQYPTYPMNFYPVNNYPMVPPMPMQVPSYWYGQ